MLVQSLHDEVSWRAWVRGPGLLGKRPGWALEAGVGAKALYFDNVAAFEHDPQTASAQRDVMVAAFSAAGSVAYDCGEPGDEVGFLGFMLKNGRVPRRTHRGESYSPP